LLSLRIKFGDVQEGNGSGSWIERSELPQSFLRKYQKYGRPYLDIFNHTIVANITSCCNFGGRKSIWGNV
jgi:hypothetical protein